MIKVIYKIHEKNASRYIEKETCMGLFSEDTQLESVFTLNAITDVEYAQMHIYSHMTS